VAFFRKDPQQVAEKLVKKGRIEPAIKELKKVLEKDPDDPNILNRIGDLYVRLRKSSEAADYYQKTAQRYASDGFYVKAIAVYKKIHRIEPTRHEVLLRLAELYERQGLVNDARAHYTQLAEHYARQNDQRSAVQTYQRMVDLEPENPGHRLKLADSYRQLGKLDETLRVYLELGRLMVKHGHADHAVQVYERAIELVPDDLGFVREAFSVLRQGGDLEAANGLLDIAERANPEVAELRSQVQEEVSASTLELEPAAATVVELVSEDEGLEGWQAVPEAMVGLGHGDAEGFEPASRALGTAEAGSVVDEYGEAPAEVPEDGLWEISGSWSFADGASVDGASVDEASEDLEVELDPLEGLSAAAQAPAISEADHEEPATREAAELEPTDDDRRREDRESDLLAEADVFIKYGLSQKAVERLDELLAVNPASWGALERLLAARLERGEEQAVVDLARRVRNGELGRGQEAWQRFEERLMEVGYRIEADRLLAVDTGGRPSVAAEELGPVAVIAASEPDFADWDAEPEDIEVLAGDHIDEIPEPPAPEMPVRVEAAERAASSSGGVDLVAPAAREFGSDGSEKLADADLLNSTSHDLVASSWLEDEQTPEAGDTNRIFEEERQFFDLANELRPELEMEVGHAVERADEQSLDEIVEGFKRGVAENIAEEDSDTHYNLGIAYREMMLIDEAIGEFQIAAKSAEHRADACTMLGQCYRDKGMADLAVKWYQRALDTGNLETPQRAGVLYELGQTFESMDDRESAYYTYLELRGVDSSFRDVRERIEALQ
jgi:tetratricopeptide (TPR) repeat protein